MSAKFVPNLVKLGPGPHALDVLPQTDARALVCGSRLRSAVAPFLPRCGVQNLPGHGVLRRPCKPHEAIASTWWRWAGHSGRLSEKPDDAWCVVISWRWARWRETLNAVLMRRQGPTRPRPNRGRPSPEACGCSVLRSSPVARGGRQPRCLERAESRIRRGSPPNQVSPHTRGG